MSELEQLLAKLKNAEPRGTTAYLLSPGAPIKPSAVATHSVRVAPALTFRLPRTKAR
jgi:hypothetical protein